MPHVIDDQGLALIRQFEGLRLDAYQDVAGIWTIGYGHIRGVTPGMRITEAQADQALLDDLAGTQSAVNSAIGDAATTDNQFSAMVVLCFNIGSANYCSSTVLQEHLAGNYQAAADAFLMWNKAHVSGELQVVAGLGNRRTAERALYLS